MRLPRSLALSTLSLLVLTFALLGGRSAGAAEIRLFSSAALDSIVDALAPQFQKASGDTLARTVDVAAALKRRIDAGEAFDVAMLNPSHIDDLIKSGKIDAATRVNFARAGIGVGVRAGTPKPDISTVEAFKQALLKAKTIGHSLGVSGVHFSTNVIPRLGIAEEIKSRIRISKGFPVGILVAKGEAEIGIHQIAELLPIQGIDIVGELPAEIQTTLIYATGVHAGAKQPEAARALASFLLLATSVPAIKKNGMEPAPR